MSAQEYQWLANYGFAAIVAIYVLVRLEPAINRLNTTVDLLSIIVAKSSGLDYEKIRREYQGHGYRREGR